jgi:hypothetical protein
MFGRPAATIFFSVPNNESFAEAGGSKQARLLPGHAHRSVVTH